MKNTKKHNLFSNFVAILSSFLILLGIFFLSYNYVQAKKLIAYEYMDTLIYKKDYREEHEIEREVKEEISASLENINEEKEEEVTNGSNDTVNRNSNIDNNYQYIGYLEIPKINFRMGIVDKDSKDNNVNRNLFIASNSAYPDVDRGNLIIAGHSGTGYKAFFRNLYKIGGGDLAKVEYNGKVYTYQVVKIYEQQKTGRIAVYRDYNKTTLTLITCTKDSDDKQTVYILELIGIE